MSFEDQITEYATMMHGNTEPTNPTPDAAIVEETPVETPVLAETPTEIVETPSIAPTNEPVVEPSTPNYNAILEEISGGAFKDVETFKGSLPKFQEYDSLTTAKTELEEKVKNMFTPTNDYVKTLNEMYANGATTDQIKSYQRLNEIGDLNTLSPFDIKVHKMVHEGYNEDIARKIVGQEFPIEDFEEGSDERLILEEKMKISSAQDLKILEQHKKDLSSFGEQQKQAQEQEKLQLIASQENHKKEVALAVPKIAEAMKGLGELNLNGKDGEEAVKLNFDYKDEFKAEIPKLINDFFVEYNLPLTAENIQNASNYISAVYWDQNKESILQSATKHVEAVTWEKALNKYENRSGLPTEPVNANIVNVNAAQSDFLHSVANGQR